MGLVTIDGAIAQQVQSMGLPVGETAKPGHAQYEAAKDLPFAWDPTNRHWEATGPDGGKHFVGPNQDGPGRRVISCGPKGRKS